MKSNVDYTTRVLEEIAKLPGTSISHVMEAYLRVINWEGLKTNEVEEIHGHFKKLSEENPDKKSYKAIIIFTHNTLVMDMILRVDASQN